VARTERVLSKEIDAQTRLLGRQLYRALGCIELFNAPVPKLIANTNKSGIAPQQRCLYLARWYIERLSVETKSVAKLNQGYKATHFRFTLDSIRIVVSQRTTFKAASDRSKLSPAHRV
jgi:hypothetical protein